jgi:hypothetical protein
MYALQYVFKGIVSQDLMRIKRAADGFIGHTYCISEQSTQA